jgi:hypothetical protein
MYLDGRRVILVGHLFLLLSLSSIALSLFCLPLHELVLLRSVLLSSMRFHHLALPSLTLAKLPLAIHVCLAQRGARWWLQSLRETW